MKEVREVVDDLKVRHTTTVFGTDKLIIQCCQGQSHRGLPLSLLTGQSHGRVKNAGLFSGNAPHPEDSEKSYLFGVSS